jgi:ornithine carbamoyltransferase
MHCFLSTHRGKEVTAKGLGSPQSVVWDETENPMPVQKATMEYLPLSRRD